MATPRWKNDSTQITARNDVDTADARLRALDIILSAGTALNGKILTSDAVGLGSWQVNPAIQAAADANTAASSAQTTANNAVSAAAVADAAAAAAATAAAAAGATATLALGAAALADANASAAAGAAATAQTTANNAQQTADLAYPVSFAFTADELIWTTGTPIYSTNQPTFPNSYIAFTITNNAEAHLDVVLKAGNWTFITNVMTRNDGGRLSADVGGNVLYDPEDLYSVTLNTAKRIIVTPVTLNTSGIYRVRFKVNGKNASSSSYVFVLNKFHGWLN